MNLLQCDNPNCKIQSTMPVYNWYKVERFAYPDHPDKRAPSGPWHLCSMRCIGELFAMTQRIDVSTMQKPNQFIEVLPSEKGQAWVRHQEPLFQTQPVPPKPTPPDLRTLKEGSIPYAPIEMKEGPWLSPVLCNHANENPRICTCPINCSCRKDMCKDKPNAVRRDT